MRLFAALLASAALLSACRKAEEPKKTGLAEAAAKVRYAETCRNRVPLEYARSYPLPLLSDGKASFRLFFYPLRSKFQKGHAMPVVEVLPPAAAARFSLGASDAACERFNVPLQLDPGTTLGPRFYPEVKLLGMRRFDLKQAELYSLLEATAAAYFAREDSEEIRRTVDDFFELFLVMSEPSLKPYYYYLSPDFWQWVEQQTGKKLFEV